MARLFNYRDSPRSGHLTRIYRREVTRPKDRYQLLGFIDDDARFLDREIEEIPVIGSTKAVATLQEDVLLMVGIGNTQTKLAVASKLESMGRDFAGIVHPAATVSSDLVAGGGLYVAPNAVISISTVFGKHVHINYGATIGHDCCFADGAFIGPGANVSGNVSLGRAVSVGAGAVLLPGVSIGQGTVVGAGAVVIGDVDENLVIAGVPAQAITG